MASDLHNNINKRYLLELGNEPQELLQPILGYASESLVSLEIACEPLLNIVSHLPSHIWIAKENSKNPSDGLTVDESAAIRLYTMEWKKGKNSNGSLYLHLNRSLRMADRSVLQPWFSYLKLFLTALAKLQVNPSPVLWRGIPGDHSNQYLVGSEVIWWSFSSCTTSLNVLQSPPYLGNVGAKTLFSMETFNGRAIRGHSQFTAEDEILLLPGTLFEVKSQLNSSSDLHIIHLCQKRPLFDLIEPPFPGAQLIPPITSSFSIETSINLNKPDYRPWYKRKTWIITILSLVMLIILAIILGTVFGSRKGKEQITTITTTFSGQPETTPKITTAATTTTTTTTTTKATTTTTTAVPTLFLVGN